MEFTDQWTHRAAPRKNKQKSEGKRVSRNQTMIDFWWMVSLRGRVRTEGEAGGVEASREGGVQNTAMSAGEEEDAGIVEIAAREDGE